MALKDYVTKVLGTLGDVNPLDHSGGLIVQRVEGEGRFEIEWIEAPSDGSWDCPTCSGSGTIGDDDVKCDDCAGTGENPELRWECTTVVIEDYDWVDWKAVAVSCGLEPGELEAQMKTGDPKLMAQAIWSAAGYHGWYQFDQYPDKLTRAEVEARFEGLL